MNENIKEIIAERIKYHSNKEKYGYFIVNSCIDICASDILEDVKKAGYRKQSEVVKEFAEKIKASPNRDYSHSYQLGLLGLTENDINNLAEQYGKED